MSTICADELFPGDTGSRNRRTSAAPAASHPRAAADAGPTPATGRRYEDFEARSSHLGDLLGGQVFPRLF